MMGQELRLFEHGDDYDEIPVRDDSLLKRIVQNRGPRVKGEIVLLFDERTISRSLIKVSKNRSPL